jgi:hypothetical protein
VVVGCGGSGKSVLARALGAALDLPVTHLDAVYFDAAWNPLPAADFAARQRELVAAPRWIIDGNHNATLPIRLAACDTVVFLDLPTRTCLRSALTRQLHQLTHPTPDPHRLTPAVLRYLATYRRHMRPRVLHNIHTRAPHATLVHLTTRRQARRWLS